MSLLSDHRGVAKDAALVALGVAVGGVAALFTSVPPAAVLALALVALSVRQYFEAKAA